VAEIRAAYRRLAQVHHPDRPTGSASRMAAINRAYAVLSDADQRRRFDLLRSRGQTTHAEPQGPATPSDEPVDERPWQLDVEQGRDLEDWRQMYAEERHLWQQLLLSLPRDAPGRADVEAALERARRDQLELENAARARAGEAPLSASDYDRAVARADQARPRGGCLVFWL
jgi:curved DNA-binding protein CbpA